jgi:hypothetical protein
LKSIRSFSSVVLVEEKVRMQIVRELLAFADLDRPDKFDLDLNGHMVKPRGQPGISLSICRPFIIPSQVHVDRAALPSASLPKTATVKELQHWAHSSILLLPHCPNNMQLSSCRFRQLTSESKDCIFKEILGQYAVWKTRTIVRHTESGYAPRVCRGAQWVLVLREICIWMDACRPESRLKK